MYLLDVHPAFWVGIVAVITMAIIVLVAGIRAISQEEPTPGFKTCPQCDGHCEIVYNNQFYPCRACCGSGEVRKDSNYVL